MEREVELEHRALEASTALARIQRTADERMTKAADLEQKVVLLEVTVLEKYLMADMRLLLHMEKVCSPQ
nr:golgin candidate 1 isoform X1 [Ipomoea batatas]